MQSSTFRWAFIGCGGAAGVSMLAFLSPVALPVAVVALPVSLCASLICANRADLLEEKENRAIVAALKAQA